MGVGGLNNEEEVEEEEGSLPVLTGEVEDVKVALKEFCRDRALRAELLLAEFGLDRLH